MRFKKPLLLGLAVVSCAFRAFSADLACESCRVILVDSTEGQSNKVDLEIKRTQARIKEARVAEPLVERLGWLYVDKAREANDPGYYKLAEQCALCLETSSSNAPAALLLKGHVWHSLHRFKDAEPIALKLTQTRGMAFDFGLLGDVEFDLGKVREAVDAYQEMVNRRPDLQSYGRIAQVRWITGDVDGAVEAMTLASGAGSPLNAEPTSWALTRLALYQLQLGNVAESRKVVARSLQILPDNAVGHAADGRIELALGDVGGAIQSFQKAADLSHLPEPQWLLADTLRRAGQTNAAAAVENELERRGAVEDPRSYALYLATRGRHPDVALRLAERELTVRGDVFTHDALAWALQANGRLPEAQTEMHKALAEGTQDARLFFHAAAIAQALGQSADAERYTSAALKFKTMLFPSEENQLLQIAARQSSVKKMSALSATYPNER
ncbi:MAG TPA: tetratricopeptide repeat protein [Verrucomicrobiae bacterium]|jgi:tetratricopeptide (TPR) repeat protein|nr:tetratricopeptide repeat protein [Verrucomicrobiae bacterium]